MPLQAPARAGHLPVGPAVVVNHSEQSVELWLAGPSLRLRSPKHPLVLKS